MMHRWRLKASRNMGVLATLSARALKVDGSCFQRLLPPGGNEPPAHRHKFGSAALARFHDIDGIGRGYIVVRLQIAGGAREAVQVMDFAPCVALAEASTHRAYPIDSFRLAAGGNACKPLSTGIGAEPGHHEHRSPSTRLPTVACG